MDTKTGIGEGMVVRSLDGDKLGKVVATEGDSFIIEKGIFFKKDYRARFDDIDRIEDDEIHLRISKDSLTRADEELPEQRATSTAETATTAEQPMTTSEARTDQGRIPLVEEEAVAQKRTQEVGAVRVTKEAHEEQQTINV